MKLQLTGTVVVRISADDVRELVANKISEEMGITIKPTDVVVEYDGRDEDLYFDGYLVNLSLDQIKSMKNGFDKTVEV
jgi:hypothetical protein